MKENATGYLHSKARKSTVIISVFLTNSISGPTLIA